MEKYDQIKWISEDHIGGSGQARSYTCTYCKRGFSNAQALGGHMNIHRRDRARLRQFSEENNSNSNNNDNNNQVSSETNPMEEIKNNINNPTVDINYDHHHDVNNNPFSEERENFRLELLKKQQSDLVNYRNPYSPVMMRELGDDHHGQVISDKELVLKSPLFHDESTSGKIEIQEELDLELRLGRERPRR